MRNMKREVGLYQKTGTVLWSGGDTVTESKEESIRDKKWRPVGRRTGGRAKQIKNEKGETEKTRLGIRWSPV